MKKLFNISFVLLVLFLLKGNGALYAHINTTNETALLESFFKKLELSNLEIELQATSTLQSDSSQDRHKENKGFEFPLFEKEEKEKEDKFTSFKVVSKQFSSFLSSPTIFFFDRFYQYSKSYLQRNENLNYFLFHKCYVLFQVFRL